MAITSKLTIENVTDVRIDKNNNPYRLIYTPRIWSTDSETGELNLIQSESHFCYDEVMFDKLKPGVVINIVSN